MNEKHENTNVAALFAYRHSTNDLLRAHQVLIDAWFDAWVDRERSRAHELLKKRQQSSELKKAV
ncbi:hypothetical protein ACVMGC_003610 [Bradyrhizobium barranii subsp. barranii]